MIPHGACRQQSRGNLQTFSVIGFLAVFGSMSGTAPVAAKSPPASSLSLPAISQSIQAQGAAGPTPAWIRFCEQVPNECTVNAAEPATINLDQDTWAALIQANEQVNGEILAVTDQDHWGEPDRWDYPDDGMGDCEDIQLLKRKRLVEKGLPRRAMRMTVVIDEEGEGHAVLMVRTDRGDLILDNKTDDVLPWQQTGYSFVKGEGADTMVWVWLGDETAPSVTANR